MPGKFPPTGRLITGEEGRPTLLDLPEDGQRIVRAGILENDQTLAILIAERMIFLQIKTYAIAQIVCVDAVGIGHKERRLLGEGSIGLCQGIADEDLHGKVQFGNGVFQ